MSPYDTVPPEGGGVRVTPVAVGKPYETITIHGSIEDVLAAHPDFLSIMCADFGLRHPQIPVSQQPANLSGGEPEEGETTEPRE